jgi:hypothetical protein
MKKTLELKDMNLSPLTETDYDVTGGGNGFWTWVAKEVVSHWDEIKQGVADGWNSVHYN